MVVPYTAMSPAAIETLKTINNRDIIPYEMMLSNTDFNHMIDALTELSESASPLAGWAASMVTTIAETYGIEFV